METFFVVAAPGLEAITAAEMRGLGLLPETASLSDVAPPRDVAPPPDAGGVEFQGSFSALYRANLYLRTANRVLVRLGDFYAASFPELRKKAGRLPWERYLKPGQPVAMHVTCHKSRLYHSDAVAERVAGAIADRLGQPSPRLKASDEATNPPQLVVVRLLNDHCTISIDSSGELLHRRGYRQETAKAPLRETLAAAMLLASGWGAGAKDPLLDPFCGSGTIAIEAALMALGLPPGLNRRFAFMDWPGFDLRRWEKSLEDAATGSRPPVGAPSRLLSRREAPDHVPSPATTAAPPLREAAQPGADQAAGQPEPEPDRAEALARPAIPIIQASDRDEGAIRIARANAERAGVLDAIEFTHRAVSAIQPPPGPGWVVTNPPYGLRVSANQDLRNLYAQLGNVLRAHCPGWNVAILSSDPRLLGQTGLKLDTSLGMVNGGVNVRLGRGKVPG